MGEKPDKGGKRMSGIKKPRAGDGNPDTGKGTVSAVQCTPERVQRQGLIADLLSAGEGNAVPLSHLVRLTGWDEREVRRQIENERRRGIPILSKHGYYLPADDAERAAFVASMRGRAREIMRTADAVEREGRG